MRAFLVIFVIYCVREGCDVASNEQRRVKLKRLIFNKYDASEVDMYLEGLNRKLRKLQLENSELVEKVKELTVKLDAFRDKEESIRNALSMAEKVSTLCIKEARDKAKKILDEAKSQSSEVISDIKCEEIKQKDNLVKLRNHVKNYKEAMLMLFRDHFRSLKEFMSKDVIYQEICEEVVPGVRAVDNEDEVKNKEQVVDELPSTSEDTTDIESKMADDIDEVLEKKRMAINEKFKDLKFGRNYDSNVSSKKSFFSVFKKVR